MEDYEKDYLQQFQSLTINLDLKDIPVTNKNCHPIKILWVKKGEYKSAHNIPIDAHTIICGHAKLILPKEQFETHCAYVKSIIDDEAQIYPIENPPFWGSEVIVNNQRCNKCCNH